MQKNACVIELGLLFRDPQVVGYRWSVGCVEESKWK